MTPVNVEICVPNPANTIKVVETLIDAGFAVVIRANAHDECGSTIFLHAYGVSDIPNLRQDNIVRPGDVVSDEERAAHRELQGDFRELTEHIGGDIVEGGPGWRDTEDQVVAPVGLQFAVDVVDDETDITRRISCAEYNPERFLMMLVEAAGLLANDCGKSIGNALARRLLLAALGVNDEVEDADEEDLMTAA